MSGSRVPVVDYTQGRLATRVRKTARYLRLYGPARTLAKVEGQYHMSGRPSLRRRAPDPGAHVGIIGCGNFAYSTIAHHLERGAGAVIRGAMDIAAERAESLARRYGGHYATTDAERLIGDSAIDLVYIASNHASHADYAIRALEAGKSVHIEKPHVVDRDQLARLCDAMERSPGRVRLGFNRPVSPFGRELAELVRAQGSHLTASWFVVGYKLPPDHWYNEPGEGGRVLGNLCHWTDFLYGLVPEPARHPIEVRPVRTGEDLTVALAFGESAGTITFATSGETFEGVRETFSLQCGDLVATMTDFQHLRADVRERRVRRRLRRRDHGHERSVLRSYAMSARGGGLPGESARYVWETAELFLGVKDALDAGRAVTVGAYSPRRAA